MIAAAGLRAMFQVPAWVTGGISTGDAEFLAVLVAAVQPELVVEIGVAAGTSSAALLYALDACPGPADRVLYSVDVRDRCYFNPHYATGAAVEAMYPAHRAQWRRRIPSDARRIGAELTPGAVDLIFIDGEHRHPYPLIDLLHMAPWARPEAWIALHDIALPRLYPQYQTYGPMRLFEAWPGEKQAGTGEAENIGAVRLPADLRALYQMARHLLLGVSRETIPAAADRDLPEPFAPLSALLRPGRHRRG